MKNFDSRTYSISDFVEWHSTGLLNLSADFQRRSVWTEKAKSYLIDTVIRGKPVPKILITQDLSQTRNIRVVVDGQQRLRAILEFMDDSFRISRAHNKEFAGRSYSALPEETKRDILKYELAIDVLFDMTYEDILDVFARINTYSIKLNKQELLNAKYLGYFKQCAYRLGYRYVSYWLKAGLMTKTEVNRMAEATLASELLIILVSGIQSPKVLETHYRRFEEEEGALADAEEKFDKVMSFLGEIYTPEDLKLTIYSKSALFYSLFSSITHALFGLENADSVPRPNLTIDNTGKARIRLDEISANYETEVRPEAYEDFVDASTRGTTDAIKRQLRNKFISKNLVEVLA